MTRNPNTRISELHVDNAPHADGRADAFSLGSLLAAGFILVVSFIVRRFYQ